MYKILIKYNDKNNLWQSYGTTTTTADATTETTSFTEFETDDVNALCAEVKKITSKIGSAEIRVISDIDFNIEVNIENNEESGEQT